MGTEIERKSLPVELKIDDANGTVTLYASVFGNVDHQGEMIVPGAFKNLDQFIIDGWLAVNHDWSEMGVASIDSATQDPHGLLVTANWYSTEDAQEARTIVKERMARGKSVKASIGYKVIEDTVETADGKPIRVLKAIELIEVSVVNLPANPLAQVSTVKSWWNSLDVAYAALKEGRTISATNRNRLKGCRKQMGDACDGLDAVLKDSDPLATQDPGPQGGPEPGVEPGGPPKSVTPPARAKPVSVDVMSLYFESLAACASTRRDHERRMTMTASQTLGAQLAEKQKSPCGPVHGPQDNRCGAPLQLHHGGNREGPRIQQGVERSRREMGAGQRAFRDRR